MLTQACWSDIISALVDSDEIRLKADIMEGDNSCTSAQAVQTALAELEELGWVKTEETADSVLVKTGWKADLFSGPASQPQSP